jgi:LAO/AO transport system kinase
MTGEGHVPYDQLVGRARGLDKRAIATLIDRFEDTRAGSVGERTRVLQGLRSWAGERCSPVVGITGTPGSGKSSLLARAVPEALAEDPTLTVAVVAIDPSSHVSGGAFLGDRTRMHFPPGETRVFVRSQAAAEMLGGVAPATFQVCELLALLFDLVVVETVGIGQSELEIQKLADHVVLVVQPLAGDEIQFLKAGIIEIPDTFVLNKCDEPAAERSYHQLVASLSLARPFDDCRPDVLRTSARTGAGVSTVARLLVGLARSGSRRDPGARERYAFETWVKSEWGRAGFTALATTLGGAAHWLAASGGYDEAQASFAGAFVQTLGAALPGPAVGSADFIG